MTLELERLGCNRDSIASAIVSNVVAQVFCDSARKFTGDTNERLYNAIIQLSSSSCRSSLSNKSVSCSNFPSLKNYYYVNKDLTGLVYAHPYSLVYGLFVEESYLRDMNKAYTLDTMEGGE